MSSTAQPRIISDPPLIVPIEELAPGIDAGRCGEGVARDVPRLPRDALAPTAATCSSSSSSRTSRARSSASAAWAPARGSRCSSGATSGDPLFLQLKEAEPSVLEPFLGRSEYDNQRPARRRGPAADAGGERHLPRLEAHRERASTAVSATSTSGSCTTGRAARTSTSMRPKGMAAVRPDVRLDARPRARAIGRPDRDRLPTSAAATPSTRRSSRSPRRTPTRTSATTTRSSRP